MKVKIGELKNLIEKILASKYYDRSQASTIGEVLLYAELIGKNTQGILKLMGSEPIQNIKPGKKPSIVKDTKVSALIDGGGNPGILVSQMAVDILIQKCEEHGIAIVGTNNTFSGTGTIGFYAQKIARKDFIGIIMSGSSGGVAPFGGIDPLFGTNPIAFGFPTEAEPLVFDMATSAITWYGLVRAKALGLKIPDGIAMDVDGVITSDPAEAMKGAVLPFDKNYKGSGLSMMIELLTGPLTGALFCDVNSTNWGNVFIAIDPDILVGRDVFKKNSSSLIQKVKSSRKQKGVKEILVPGERALRKKQEVEHSGEVEIEDKLYKELLGLRL